ncbi:hypothetical protein A8709_31460 [Paenibacillus pectinilyticus]|uniref:Uncharacterized protein n=1 Tax=Paenibacillus pectinilyticus TaxID=512399 RepID=A0A1C0ZWD4_9BACL|nr:hypothetical protein [Paenibacillus pectinilyticus]OCT12348.1 hypothetical protein A8709_31460 [Paenibacillus pectinilyticus]
MTILTSIQQRQDEIITRIATAAYAQPIMSNGFLFEGDVRDNFYYASYLFAASVDSAITFEGDRTAAKDKAERIFHHLLEIQDQNPASETYGHWPLNLRPTPQEASKNTLPVELMGSLMVYFAQRYQEQLSDALREAFETSIRHIYNSNFYRKPVTYFGHHEAKYTAAKLIFGQRYGDEALVADGYESLRLTLARIKEHGMTEYGGLPWFWHWVQAFTCAWQLIEDGEIRHELSRMLDYLWNERATFYLGGAWVGPHARIWPHDMPKDTNVLHDYVQFGDFQLPDHMPRTEYAGFLVYEAPLASRQKALHRAEPVEIKRQIPKQIGTAVHEKDFLHSYVYLTESFAMGGMWERIREFDNEQHRWDVAFPLDTTQEGVNHAYFFHPDVEQPEGDLRHQSEYTEVLFHENVIMASYAIPDDQPAYIKGCLPLGEWVEEPHGLFGRVGEVYMAVYIQQAYDREVLDDRIFVTSRGRANAVVVECVDQVMAASYGISDVHHFADRMKSKQPQYVPNNEISYTSLSQQTLLLASGPNQEISRLINEIPIDWSSYTVA